MTENAWVRENRFAELPELVEDADARAKGINLTGDTVGYSTNANGRFRAVVWWRQ